MLPQVGRCEWQGSSMTSVLFWDMSEVFRCGFFVNLLGDRAGSGENRTSECPSWYSFKEVLSKRFQRLMNVHPVSLGWMSRHREASVSLCALLGSLSMIHKGYPTPLPSHHCFPAHLLLPVPLHSLPSFIQFPANNIQSRVWQSWMTLLELNMDTGWVN